MADVYLRYVGKKPWSVDSIGGTGTIWNGNGDIQPVPAEVAEKLINYPDQWELAEPMRPARKGKQTAPAKDEEPVKDEEPIKGDDFEA